VTVYTDAALQSSEAAAFLAGFDDDFAGVLAVGVGSWVLAVLFATVFAAVALSAVGRVAVFDEVFVVAVWAGQGLADRHKQFTGTYYQPLNNHSMPLLTPSEQCRCCGACESAALLADLDSTGSILESQTGTIHNLVKTGS
jgi:hypothetical protein